jgi:hypothetical protein
MKFKPVPGQPGQHKVRSKEGLPLVRLTDELWLEENGRALFVWDPAAKDWTPMLLVEGQRTPVLQEAVDAVKGLIG